MTLFGTSPYAKLSRCSIINNPDRSASELWRKRNTHESSVTSSTYLRGMSSSWTPSLLCSHWLPHESPHCMVLSFVFLICNCLSAAISVLVLLLPDIWVWLSCSNVSCNVSEISVVLPGPASMNPPNVRVTL